MNPYDSTCCPPVPAVPRRGIGFGAASGNILMRIVAVLFLWRERVVQRRALGRLDDHLLEDIGLDRATAKYEASKPFWRH